MEIESTKNFTSIKKYSNNNKNIKISMNLLLKYKKEIFQYVSKIYIIRIVNDEKKIKSLNLSLHNFNNKLTFVQNNNFKLFFYYNYLPNSLKIISNTTQVTIKSFLPNKIDKMYIIANKNIFKKNMIPYNISEILSPICLNIKNFNLSQCKIKYESIINLKLSNCYINKHCKKVKNVN